MGLSDAFAADGEWRQRGFLFQATEDASDRMRLQICYLSTGTLWIDDAGMVESDGRRGQRWSGPPRPRATSCNGAFEGRYRWLEQRRALHHSGWHMPVNRLFGELVQDEESGVGTCLKVAMSPETTPVSFFDCMQARHSPVRTLLTGNIGWMPTTPGRLLSLGLPPGRPRDCR